MIRRARRRLADLLLGKEWPSTHAVHAELIKQIRDLHDDREALLAAADGLVLGRLSSSSGGDSGMVFDEFDAAVERERQGTVTFDAGAVARFSDIVVRVRRLQR